LNPKTTNHELVEKEERYVPQEANGRLAFHGSRDSSLVACLLAVWHQRRFIVQAFVFGFVVAAAVSWLIPAEYDSTTRIMPPEKHGLGGLAGMLAGNGGEGIGGTLISGYISEAVGLKTSGALYIGVLRSSTVEDALIEQFKLREVYRVRYEKDAREILSDNTGINEDRKSGIISITVTDRSPRRAQQLAAAYIEILNQLLAQLNTSSAHRERLFLEDRLKGVKKDLDAASKDLSEFSSRNLTLDVKEQGKAVVMGVAELEGELIAAQSQLAGLEQIYSDKNVRVRSLRARIATLKRKLSQWRGTDTDSSDTTGDAEEIGVSIAKLPALGVTFYDLYRRVKIQETVFEILTKQYELAKVEEAKEVPTIQVLDPARVPEVKSHPQRRLVTLIGALVAAMMAACFVIASMRILNLDLSHPLRILGFEVSEGLKEDWAIVCSRTPKPLARITGFIWARISRRSSNVSASS